MFDFKFGSDYRFAWPVTVLVPTEGGQEERKFTGTFRLLSQEELDKAAQDGDAGVCKAVLVGWKQDEVTIDGAPAPYSEANRDRFLAVSFVRFAIARAYYDAVGGALRVKN